MKSFWKVIRTVLIVLICIEICLHFYNPFAIIKKNRNADLPNNAKYELKDIKIPGLDKDFIHTKNSLGFRGSELPENDAALKIICMGGSSTECFYLNDGSDWPALLGGKMLQDKPGIWLNNAGVSGKSASEQTVLLKKHIVKLKPDYILLMCGLDDIGIAVEKPVIIAKNDRLSDFYNFLEIPKTIRSTFNNDNGGEDRNAFQVLDLTKAEMLEMSDSQILQRIAREQPLISAYKKHLQEIADICKDNGIRLILVSEVILYGDETDNISNINLGNLKIGEINGRTEALLLKQYNKSTYEIAVSNNLHFINLSSRLPKDSRYFYDGYHFTKDGAEMVANIIFDESKDWIEK